VPLTVPLAGIVYGSVAGKVGGGSARLRGSISGNGTAKVPPEAGDLGLERVWSGAGECQQHDGRFSGDQGVGRARRHVQPRPWDQLKFFAVNG
jgi:hypothetical protein